MLLSARICTDLVAVHADRQSVPAHRSTSPPTETVKRFQRNALFYMNTRTSAPMTRITRTSI